MHLDSHKIDQWCPDVALLEANAPSHYLESD